MLKHFLNYFLITSILILINIGNAFAQEGAAPGVSAMPPQIQQAIQSGQVTPQQVQQGMQAVQQGQVTPQQAQQLQQQLGDGSTLTPAEIEAGKKLLDQQNQQIQEAPPSEVEKTDPSKEKPKPEEAKIESPETPIEEAKKREETVEDFIESDDNYFTKSGGLQQPELEVFGQKLFSRAPETFDPIRSIPVSDDYQVGPEDEIRIVLWGRMDQTYNTKVDNEGKIIIPQIGPLTVAGLTFKEVKELIRQRGEAITGVNVNVSMGNLRTIQVFALGEVKNPGLYTVSSLATVANVLLSAGGPTPLGSLRNVQLKRNGNIISDVDFYDFLLRGDTSSDTRLMPGDVVYVPQSGPIVWISGNVQRPAGYELKDISTLQYALELAGGFRPKAYNQRIQIERAFQHQHQIILDITYDELKKQEDIVLQDDDLIRIFMIFPDPINAVYLYGNVLRPGPFAFKRGLRILDLIPDMGSLSMDTYFDYALVKRYHPATTESELIPFDLGKLLFSKSREHNIALQPLDEVYIFNKSLFIDREYANIRGQVRKPGKYYITDMRIQDLIQRGGGLTDQAYLPKGELIRFDKDQKRITLYFDVSAAMQNSVEHNLRLQNKDEIVIHSLWEDQWKEFVNIKGQVKNPGEFVLSKEMRLRDLFFKAGNFTKDAYKEQGHIYRTNWKTKEVTIHTFNVDMAMNGHPDHNLPLEDLDEVIIRNIREYVPEEFVTISGEVNNPGKYPYGTNMRIKDIVLVSGNITRNAYMEQGHLYRTDRRTKEMTIHTFDLQKALDGEIEHNLLLKESDNVVIHDIFEYQTVYTVSVNGLVKNPGEYPYATNMTVKDLIFVAGNVRDAAFMDQAEITRYTIVDGNKVNTSILTFDINLAQKNDPAHNHSLQPFDVLTIKAIPDWWEKKRVVTLTGEVMFPGVYPIRKDETISSVIERAGGYTEYAYLKGAVFQRISVQKQQQQSLDELMQQLEMEVSRASSQEIQSVLTQTDIQAQRQFMDAQQGLLTRLKRTKATGRVIVNMLEPEQMKNSTLDIALEDGDELHIPLKKNIVSILGAVYNPAAVVFDQTKAEIQYYLNMTGGLTENAEEDMMYIVRADGTVVSKRASSSWWRKFENIPLEPGDTVLVPEKIIRPDFMRDAKDITEILYQIAVIAGITITQVF